MSSNQNPIVPHFSIKVWAKISLGVITSFLFGPWWLVAFLHRLRGVKIHNIWRVFIAGQVLIDSRFPELVEIEEEVYITRGVIIHTHFAPPPFLEAKIGGVRTGRVIIKRGAYIGMNSIILPGVTVGEGAVIGTGSVVTKNVADYTMVAGNPARVIKSVYEIRPMNDAGMNP